MSLQGRLACFRDLAALLDTSECSRDLLFWRECEDAEDNLEAMIFFQSGLDAAWAPTPLEALMVLPRQEALSALTELSVSQMMADPVLAGFLLKCIVSKIGPSGITAAALARIPEKILCLACHLVQVAETGTVARKHWLNFLTGLSRVHPLWINVMRSTINCPIFLARQLCDPNLAAGLHFLWTWTIVDTAALPDFVAAQGHLCILFMLRAAATVAQKDQAASLLNHVLCQIGHVLSVSAMSDLARHGLADTLTRTPDTPNVVALAGRVVSFHAQLRDQLVERGIVSRLLAWLDMFEADALRALSAVAVTRPREISAGCVGAVDQFLNIGPPARHVLRVLAADPAVAARVVRSRRSIELL
jgi:hypothetical protein